MADSADWSRKTACRVLALFFVLSSLVYWVGISQVELSSTRGHVIGGDGLFYYEYLPSLLSDAPLDFCQLREKLHQEGVAYNWDAPYLRQLPEGKCATAFPFGWALLTAPFFLIAHLASLALAAFSGARTDGYGFLYESVTNYGAVVLGLLAVLALYKTARLRLSRRLSLLASLGLVLASNAIYYSIAQASLAHAPGAFCVAYAVSYWVRLNDRLNARHILLCALFLALATLVRPQLGILPLFLFLQLRHRHGKTLQLWPLPLAMLVSALLLTANWFLFFDRLVLVPQGPGFLQPLRPELLNTLFSLRHGLFTWHPVYLVCVLGFVFGSGRLFNPGVFLCSLFILAAQLYLNSCATDWWAGYSFGNRRFVDVLPFFHVGLTHLVDRFRKPVALCAVALVLILWNALFAVQYRFGFIPRGEAITLEMMVSDKFRLLTLEHKY